MFYPAHGKKYAKEAIMACKECPVKKQCLDHALKYEEYGYWAGTTANERKEMRSKLGIEVISINTFLNNQYAEEKAKIQESIPKIKGRGRKVAQCGTRSGYNAHLRKKEPTCQACKEAHTKSVIEFNQNKKEKENEVLL